MNLKIEPWVLGLLGSLLAVTVGVTAATALDRFYGYNQWPLYVIFLTTLGFGLLFSLFLWGLSPLVKDDKPMKKG